MSYEICYSKNFIKTSKGYIPLVLSGSNNCYEYNFGKERRERTWTIYWCKELTKISSEQEILDFITKQYKDSEYGDFCVFNGKNVYGYEAILNFYKNGIKNARTVEEYLSYGKYKYTNGTGGKVYGLDVFLMHYDKDTGNWRQDNRRNIRTTSELENAIEELQQYHNCKDTWLEIKFTTNEKIVCELPKTIDGACIVKYKARYLAETTTSGYVLVKDKNQAKVFNTYDEAAKVSNQYGMKIIKWVKCKEIAKDFMVRIKDYGYFAKFSKYGYRYSYQPLEKFTEKRAKEILEKLQRMFGDKREFELVRCN